MQPQLYAVLYCHFAVFLLWAKTTFHQKSGFRIVLKRKTLADPMCALAVRTLTTAKPHIKPLFISRCKTVHQTVNQAKAQSNARFRPKRTGPRTIPNAVHTWRSAVADIQGFPGLIMHCDLSVNLAVSQPIHWRPTAIRNSHWVMQPYHISYLFLLMALNWFEPHE